VWFEGKESSHTQYIGDLVIKPLSKGLTGLLLSLGTGDPIYQKGGRHQIQFNKGGVEIKFKARREEVSLFKMVSFGPNEPAESATENKIAGWEKRKRGHIPRAQISTVAVSIFYFC
jgi:hypothetical protein